MAEPLDNTPNVLYTGHVYSLAQTDEFAGWLTDLRDVAGRARILKRLVRLADGHLGDAKPIGDGVSELRMVFGPGYRACFMRKGAVVLLLLAGGDKDSQARDIERAKELARSDCGGIEDETV